MNLTSAMQPDSDDPMINLEDVSLIMPSKAGSVTILQDLHFRAYAGETAALIGPSGSGKTSLLMVISGLESISGGMIHVAGQNIKDLGENALARFRREHIGIVFQSFHLFPNMTAHENVMTPLELCGIRDNISDRAAESLDEVGLGHRLHHYPGQLSGGEQQRVAIARALVGRPPILLADEPTGNLNRETSMRIADMLFSLVERHRMTLILVTHDETLAQRCSHIQYMHDGTIIDRETL